MLFLNISTGVIFVLLGMRYVRKGLDRLFGSQLVDWLQQMTNNRYQAFFGGMVAGAIAPSSSAIAMLSVQILNQTSLTAGRMLAVVLGANVGITISVQLLAFRLQDYAGVFLLTGGNWLFILEAGDLSRCRPAVIGNRNGLFGHGNHRFGGNRSGHG
jgi:phosphate:Na+ symporter